MYEKNTITKNHKNVWKKCAHILERWAANYSAQGVWGFNALMKATSAVNSHPSRCQPTKPFFEQWVGIESPTLWLLGNNTHHWATTTTNTNIQMYEKNSHTFVWEKQPYKCMIKTSIEMYDKNTHTNVWKKQPYKCMRKTSIQMYDKNSFTNVW